MSDQVRINGNQYAWGSIIVKIDGDRFYGFTELTYGDARTRKFTYGMGKSHAPRGRTPGKYEPAEGKLKGAKSSVQALRKALAAKSTSGTSYGNPSFEVVAQYVETGEQPITIELEDTVVIKDDSSESEGTDELQDEVGISYMRVRRNGLVLFDDTPG